MNLTLDIGNTVTKVSVFCDNKLIHSERFTKPDLKEIKFFLKDRNIDKVISSVVGEIDEEILTYFDKNYFHIRFDHNTPMPIENTYLTPETLGKDRLAAIIGAFYKYPDRNCLVIDAGTCITYDLLTKEGEYLGGNISPGIEMRLKAMNHYTSGLPLVEKGQESGLIGRTTEDALRNGAITGAICEATSFIEEFSQKFNKIVVLITGGDKKYFVKSIKTEIFAFSHLVDDGLNNILEYKNEYEKRDN